MNVPKLLTVLAAANIQPFFISAIPFPTFFLFVFFTEFYPLITNYLHPEKMLLIYHNNLFISQIPNVPITLLNIQPPLNPLF